jgi:hypothetical protein
MARSSQVFAIIVGCLVGWVPGLGPGVGEAAVPDRAVRRAVDQARLGSARGAHFAANRRITGFLYAGKGIGRFSVQQMQRLTAELDSWQATDAWRRYANARRVALDLEPGHRTLRAITRSLRTGKRPLDGLAGYFESLVGRVPFRSRESITGQERLLYGGEGIGRFKPDELMRRLGGLPRSLGLEALHDHVGARFDALMKEPGQRTLRRLGDFAEAQWQAGGYLKSLVNARIYPRVDPYFHPHPSPSTQGN